MADIFPALVSVYRPDVVLTLESPFENVGLSDSGAEKFSDCRVIVQKNTLIVGINSPRGPVLALKQPISEVFKDSQFTRVILESGSLVVFAPSKGCGCGSRLRSWNPYGSIVSR